MIIFYNKTTGAIEGNIEGRIHDESHLKMWVGDKNRTERIICQWKKEGTVWLPDMNEEQRNIFISLDKKETKPSQYKVDITTKRLELK